MPPFGPIKQKDLIYYLRIYGFKGPFFGSNHPYMEKGDVTVWVPNPHRGVISKGLLNQILKQAGIEKSEWEAF